MVIEHLDTPTPRSNDVLVRVDACGIVPNLGNILRNWTTWFPERPFNPLVLGSSPSHPTKTIRHEIKGLRPQSCRNTDIVPRPK